MSELNYAIVVKDMKTGIETVSTNQFSYDDVMAKCNEMYRYPTFYCYPKLVPQDLTTLTVEQFTKLYDENDAVRDLVANFIRENITFDVEERATDLTVISASIVRPHSTYPLGGTDIDNRDDTDEEYDASFDLDYLWRE